MGNPADCLRVLAGGHASPREHTRHNTTRSIIPSPCRIRGLAAEDFPLLLLPAGEFAALRLGLPRITKEAALAGTRVPDGGFAALFASAPVATVTRSSTLEEVRSRRFASHVMSLSAAEHAEHGRNARM